MQERLVILRDVFLIAWQSLSCNPVLLFSLCSRPSVRQPNADDMSPWQPLIRSLSLFITDSEQANIVDLQVHLNMTSSRFDQNTDLVVRFSTGLLSRHVFFADLNGLQMARRETRDTLPIAGNFYPATATAFIQESRETGCRRLSVIMRQAAGVASLQVGLPLCVRWSTGLNW